MTLADQHGVAQVVIGSGNLTDDLAFFTGSVGFRLNAIYPSDDPQVAILNGYGLEIRLDRAAPRPTGQTIILPTGTSMPLDRDSAGVWSGAATGGMRAQAPNGVVVEVPPAATELTIPKPTQAFEVRRLSDGASWVIGRAGMHYRDLVPDRLGGSIIASHIRIPDGGPVPDMVHYHTVGFQLIYCYHGWVRLVYEDQGPPFLLEAGDCVTQPPGIRHQVLEASDELQVIEIAVPAEHMTTIDHELSLPTPHYQPEREFQGQVFCHYRSTDADWQPWYQSGFVYSDTGVARCSANAASVHIARPDSQAASASLSSQHHDDILFAFVTDGEVTLSVANHHTSVLVAGDAFVIPPATDFAYTASANAELLEVRILKTDAV